MTPTHLFYVVQHFAVPEPIRPEDWQMTLDGEATNPMTFTYEDLRRLAGAHGAYGHGVLRQRCQPL